MGRLPNELRIFMRVSVASTAATWLIVLIFVLKGWAVDKVWPLFQGTIFWDFYDYFARFRLLHTTQFFSFDGFPFTYLAPGVPLYRFFYAFGLFASSVVFLAIAAGCIFFAGFRFSRAAMARSIDRTQFNNFLFVTLVFSYPLLLCLHRGNLELIVVIGLASGAWAYWTGRTWAAAILWGVFGSVKLYPLILLALFLSARQYKQMLAAIGAAIATTFLSLLYIGPNLTYAAHGIWGSLPRFTTRATLSYDSTVIGFDHSIFALLKVIAGSDNPNFKALLSWYIPAFVVLGTGLYFLRIRKLPPANQLLALIVCSVLLPPTSYDYSLLNLYIPFAVISLIAMENAGPTKAHLTKFFVLFALLFTPTNFISLHGYTVGGQIKCLLLVVLLYYSLTRPIESERAADFGGLRRGLL